MKYKNETGAILGSGKVPLHIVDGTPGNVDFPASVIMELHKQSPGSVYALSHVHPPTMKALSSTDMGLLESWAYVMYPFPMRVMTIAEMHTIVPGSIFAIETCYLGLLESKESWIARGKKTARKFEIVKEYENGQYFSKKDDRDSWYGRILLNRSYELELQSNISKSESTAFGQPTEYPEVGT